MDRDAWIMAASLLDRQGVEALSVVMRTSRGSRGAGASDARVTCLPHWGGSPAAAPGYPLIRTAR
jgi:hypothetical protein